MSEKGNKGMNKLANVLHGMMKQCSESPLVLDFGVINEDYSLSTNSFKNPIPKSEYSVCRCITYDPGVPLTQSYNDGEHSQPDAGFGGAHTHDIRLPEKMYWIRPGDKVLVAWVGKGDSPIGAEPVVIDIVLNGSRVG